MVAIECVKFAKSVYHCILVLNLKGYFQLFRVLEEEDKEDFDMVKEAQKLAGDTRTLAGLVDDVSGMRDYDLVSDIFGGKPM